MNYTLGHNPYSDLTQDEFSARFNLGKYSKTTRNKFPVMKSAQEQEKDAVNKQRRAQDDDLPHEVDWEAQGAVAPVKDQGSCGSCWAFAAIGTIESLRVIQTGANMTLLSEQELVDCAGGGCFGGYPAYDGYEFVIANGGVSSGEE